MSSSGPPVERRLHAAAAELALDALPTLAPGARVLIAGAGALAAPMGEALRSRALSPVGLVGTEPAVGHGLVVGELRAPPFAGATFEAALAHLVPVGWDEDRGALDDVIAAVVPGGWVVVTALLEGSFDELFDLLTEVSEQESASRLRAAVTDARRGLVEEKGLRSLFAARSLELESYGEEERALWFAGGAQAVADPLLWEGLLGAGLKEEVRSPRIGHALARFIDAYFPEGRFPVRVRTAVARARAGRGG